MKAESLKSVLWLFVIIAWLLSSAALAAEDQCMGFRLPSNARKVGENRYFVGQSWDATMKFYKKTYGDSKSIKRETAVSVPGVKVIHYRNLSGGEWSEANVSQIKGETYIFVMAPIRSQAR